MNGAIFSELFPIFYQEHILSIHKPLQAASSSPLTSEEDRENCLYSSFTLSQEASPH